MRSSILEDLLEHEEIGKKLYIDFIEQQLRGEKSVCEPMQRRNLKTFMSMNNIVKTKVQEKVIKLQEEKSLISRYLRASRKRPDLDIKFLVGNFEFSVVLKTLFTPDGEALMCSHKSKTLHLIEEMQCQHNGDEEQLIQNDVLLIDAMAVVNHVNKIYNHGNLQGKHMLDAFYFLSHFALANVYFFKT